MRFEECNPQQRNRTEWVALWSDMHRESLPNDAAPEVGFEDSKPVSGQSPDGRIHPALSNELES